MRLSDIGCSPISSVRLHEDVQDVTVLVDRAPQILLATLDRDEGGGDLVEMPGVSHPTAAAPQPPRVGPDRTAGTTAAESSRR